MSKEGDDSSASVKNSQPKPKKMKFDHTLIDKPEEETIRADFAKQLDGALKGISMYINDDWNLCGFVPTSGVVYQGKPGEGLGYQAYKFFERQVRESPWVFPRHVAKLTKKLCEDTFKRAACCSPSIVLLIGLEDAGPDVEAIIARGIKDVMDSGIVSYVLATTLMYEKVSEKLRACFNLVDLEKVADNTHQD